jgi:uncharacterized membrane protein YbhN (UPF0104 family)
VAGTLRYLIIPVALALAAFLIYRISRQYTLDEVLQSIAAIPVSRLLLAGSFAALSYLCLTGFDWLAVRYVHHPLPWWKTAVTSFTALSIGHNLGFAFLSSGAIRYRFYSRFGLNGREIVMAIGFCALTGAVGLLVLGGVSLLLSPTLAGEYLRLPRATVIAIGSVCLAVAAIYLVLSAVDWGTLRIGKWAITIPPLRLALGQTIIGPLNFAMVAACLYHAMAAVSDVTYVALAAIYVIGNFTAIMSHVPGGLGVLESVVMFFTGGGQVIGALIVFRVIYFFVPLAIGGSLFLIIESFRLVGDHRR